MERLEERTDSFSVLIDERLSADQAVANEQRVSRDELEPRYVHRKHLGKGGQHCDLELERFLDAGAPRKAEHPLVVDDRNLKVVPVVDVENRRWGVSECVSDQFLAIASHGLMLLDIPDHRVASRGRSLAQTSVCPLDDELLALDSRERAVRACTCRAGLLQNRVELTGLALHKISKLPPRLGGQLFELRGGQVEEVVPGRGQVAIAKADRHLSGPPPKGPVPLLVSNL